MKTFFLLLAFGLCAPLAAETVVTNLLAKPPAEVRLTDRQETSIRGIFDALAWDHTAGHRCHHPAFRIQSTDSGKTTLDATICFACANVRFAVPAAREMAGFTLPSPSAEQLRQALEALFPDKPGVATKP